MLTMCGCVVFGLVPSILKAKRNAHKFKYMYIFAVYVYASIACAVIRNCREVFTVIVQTFDVIRLPDLFFV